MQKTTFDPLKMAALFYLLYDIRGCYSSVDKQAAALYEDGGIIFSYFSSEQRTDRVHEKLRIDGLFVLLEKSARQYAGKNEIERAGRVLFGNICGALYLFLAEHETALSEATNEALIRRVAETKVKLKDLAARHKDKAPTGFFGARKRMQTNKELIKALDSSEMILKKKMGESRAINKRLLKLLKPHYLPGASLDSFINILNNYFPH